MLPWLKLSGFNFPNGLFLVEKGEGLKDVAKRLYVTESRDWT